jgi:peptidoglycan/LPS O-acetylase OafA/YrhL
MQDSPGPTAVDELRSRTPGRRIVELDALRGLAAFIVIWHHFRLCFVTGEPRWWLRPLFAGHAAVILFFVLSGYVLAIPYWRGKQTSYAVYVVRRFFRIYVPYAAAVFVAAVAARHFFAPDLPLTVWVQSNWHTPVTTKLLAKQLFEMPTGNQLNPAFWSLRYEIEMSIVFPLLCWLILRTRWWVTLAVTLSLLALGVYLDARFRERGVAVDFFIDTIAYAPCFILGALMSWKREFIEKTYERTPVWIKCVVLVLALIGYFDSHVTAPQLFAIPIAACAVLIFAQHSRARRLLITAIPEYLGRISYSMYLMHIPVLLVTLVLLYGRVPFLALVGIYTIATFVCSHLFCVGVEEPALRLGKRASGILIAVPPLYEATGESAL